MNRKKLDDLKSKIAEKTGKADDLDVIITEIMKLPPGQLKKVLTDKVMEVLEKYGYTE